MDIDFFEEEGNIFFCGGLLCWFVWYEVGVGYFDVQCDFMLVIIIIIRVYIEEN